MRKMGAQQGFTIVELLIVVVVIAILAAITVVSYNGITGRARDSNLQSTASQIEKKIRANQTIRGSEDALYREPETNSFFYGREQFLAYNDLTAAAAQSCLQYSVVDGNDAHAVDDPCYPALVVNQVPQFDKTKLHLSAIYRTAAGPNFDGVATAIVYSYWSSAKSKWISTLISTETGSPEEKTTTEHPCGPLQAYPSTYDSQCRYLSTDWDFWWV